MGAYNPMSYHNGSVWPHDNALIAAGLMRYGFVDEAQQVVDGLLDAAEAFGGRLPELFCGFDRAEFGRPVPYPTSCSPQAWASATPSSSFARCCGSTPGCPTARPGWRRPCQPGFPDLVLRNLPLAGSRVTLDLRDGRVASLDGVPAGIEIVPEPRPISSSVHRPAPPGSTASTSLRPGRCLMSDKPMRIAMVAPPYYPIPPQGYGGIEAVVAMLVDGLVDRGHDVTLDRGR